MCMGHKEGQEISNSAPQLPVNTKQDSHSKLMTINCLSHSTPLHTHISPSHTNKLSSSPHSNPLLVKDTIANNDHWNANATLRKMEVIDIF